MPPANTHTSNVIYASSNINTNNDIYAHSIIHTTIDICVTYAPILEHDYWVIVEIRQVQRFALDLDIGMFLHQQPADMSKEKASLGVVWVSISLRELVVGPVIPGPLKHRVLQQARRMCRNERHSSKQVTVEIITKTLGSR